MSEPAAAAPLRAAVLGLGRAGTRHASLLATLPGVELVGLGDPDARARARLRGFGFAAPLHGSDQALLAGTTPALVAVCVPQSQRADVARACLEAGAAVWCERPLAHTLVAAEPVAALAAERGLALGCAFALALTPVFAEARRIVRAGALGPLRRARASAYVSRVFSAAESRRYRATRVAGGALAHTGADLLALVVHLFGLPVEARATWSLHYGEVEDEMHAVLRLESGLEVGLDTSWSAPGHPRLDHVLELEGERGRLLASDDALELELGAAAADWPAGTTRRLDAELPQPARFVAEGEGEALALAAFVARVRDGAMAAASLPGDDGLAVQRVLDAIYASARAGGTARSVAR